MQCGSGSSRNNLVGMDKFSSITGSDHFRVQQLGMLAAGEMNCATLRLQLQGAKTSVSPAKKRSKRSNDDSIGTQSTAGMYLTNMFIVLMS